MKLAFAPRSFRMRIMLLSVSISGAILLGFGWRTWHLLHGLTGLERLDGEMKALARNQLASPRRDGGWGAFEDSLQYLSSLDPSRAFAFVVVGRDGEERRRSATWPAALASGTILDAVALDAVPPMEPDFFRSPDFRGPPGPLDGPPDFNGFGPPDGPPEFMRPERGEPPAGGNPPRAPEASVPAPVPGFGLGDGPERASGYRQGQGPRSWPSERFPVKELLFQTRTAGDRSWRVAVLASPRDILVIAADLEPFFAETGALRDTFLAIFALAMVAIGAGGWFLAQRALKPVNALIAAAESITAQELERRLPEQGSSEEFDRLNRVFNSMLERLDRSFKQATRFSADAAHELKTPLTILQGQLNQALQEAPPGSPLQQKLGQLLEEVQRLTVIIRRLLLLSLADAGRLKVTLAPVALDSFVESIIEDVEILAPELEVKSELSPGIVVEADAALLQQAVQNLVNNAIKYNVPQGKIHFSLFRQAGKVRLTVANTSRGIAAEDRKRVFHRFYRGDPAHSREVDGLGLGLSLAREIVRSHHGKLWLADAPEGWVLFVLELPEARV
ncbi:MAG: HAMP domain-containing protein [Candidatus Hydrogenedentes bacterium]|nr:HAMP domain-containing protein [Candidatus Hydrogenedentota bacterium]